MDIREAVELFMVFKRAERLQHQTLHAYYRYLREFTEFVGVNASTTIRSSQVVRFMVAQSERIGRDGKKISDKTLLAYYRALSSFFNWLETCDEAGNPPSPLGHGHNKKVKPPKLGRKIPRVASWQDLDRLIDSIPAGTWIDMRDRAILKLFRDTGLRVSELVGLRVADLNFAEREAFVLGGKGDKDRFVFFTEDASAAIRGYLFMLQVSTGQTSEYLFCSAVNRFGSLRAKPITVWGIGQMIFRRCDRLGIKRINPHSIRHLFCDKALNSDNMPLETVSKLVGHTSTEFTERVRKSKLKRDYDRQWNSGG